MLNSKWPLLLFDCVRVSLWRECFVFPGTGELFGYMCFMRVKNTFCFQDGYEGVFSFSPAGLFFFWSTLLRVCPDLPVWLPPMRCGDSQIPLWDCSDFSKLQVPDSGICTDALLFRLWYSFLFGSEWIKNGLWAHNKLWR